MYKVTREVLTTTSEKKSGFDTADDDFETDDDRGLKKSGYSYRFSKGKDFRSTDEDADIDDWQDNEGTNASTFSKFYGSNVNNYNTIGSSSYAGQNINRSTLTTATGTTPATKLDGGGGGGGGKVNDKTGCTCCPYGYHVDLDFLKHLNADEYENVRNDPRYLLKHHRRLHEMQQQQFQQRAESSTTTNNMASINSQLFSSTQQQQMQPPLQRPYQQQPQQQPQQPHQVPTLQSKLQQPGRSPYQSTTTLQQHQQYDRDEPTYENAITLYGKNVTNNTTSSSATGSYQQRYGTNGYINTNNATTVVTNGYTGNDGNDVRRQEMVYVAENGATTTRVIEEVHRTRTTIINLDSDEEDRQPPDELEKPERRPNNQKPRPPRDDSPTTSPEPSSPGFDSGEKLLPRQKPLVDLQRKLQLIQPVDQRGPLRTYVNEASPRPVDERDKDVPDKVDKVPTKKISQPQPKPLDLDFLDTMETERPVTPTWIKEKEELLRRITIMEREKRDKENNDQRLRDLDNENKRKIEDLRRQLNSLTEEYQTLQDKLRSQRKTTRDIGVGDYKVDEEVQLVVQKTSEGGQQPVRIHEKELNTEETTEIREKEIKTIFVTGIDDKFSLAKTAQPTIQKGATVQQQFTQKETRSIGIGDGNVFEDNQKKFEVHEKELRTVYLGGSDATKVSTRNVGILCKAAMRDVGMVHSSEEEKPLVRNIAVGAGEIGISESDISTSFDERSTSVALNRGELVSLGGGGVSTTDQLVGGNEESYFASSGFCQTTLTNLKGGLADMRSDQLRAYLDELLKREIHSIGIQCQFSTENKGTDAGRVGYDIASVGVSDDTIDVDVVPVRVMKSVAIDNRPSLFHRCVGTEFIYKLDVGTNTRTQGLFLDKGSNTVPKPAFSIGMMTEPKPLVSAQTGTDLSTFFAMGQYRTTGSMTDDVDMYNKRVNTEMNSEEYEQRIGTTNKQASSSYLAAQTSTSGVQEVRTDEEKATGYRRYVEETVEPGYLVSYKKTTRTRSRPESGPRVSSGSRSTDARGYTSSTVVQTTTMDKTTADKTTTDRSPHISRKVQFGENTSEVTNRMLGLDRVTESKSLIGSDGRTQLITETKGPGYSETVIKESYSSADGKTVGIPLVPGMPGFPDQYLSGGQTVQQSSSTYTTGVPIALERRSGKIITSSTSESTTSTKSASMSGSQVVSDQRGPSYYTEKTITTKDYDDGGVGDSADFITTLQDGKKIITQVQCPGYQTTKVYLDNEGQIATKLDGSDGSFGARVEFDVAGGGSGGSHVTQSYSSERKTYSTTGGISGVVSDVRSGDGLSAVVTGGGGVQIITGGGVGRADSSFEKSSKTFVNTTSSTGGIAGTLKDQEDSGKLTFSGNQMGVKTVIRESYGPNNIKTVTTEKVDMMTGQVISSSTTQSHYESIPNFEKSSSSSLSSALSGFSKSTFGFARSGITSEKFIPDQDLSSASEMYVVWLKDKSKVKQIDLDQCKTILQKRWFHTAGAKESSAYLVEGFLSYLNDLSPELLKYVINCIDGNHNTVLHYAISYNNMDVANIILNTNLSNVDQPNAAGYSPLMLAALTIIPTDANKDTLKKLFALGNINAKSTDSTGQTPLMLAVGHGRLETVDLLLSTGKCDVNIKDSDGSTALMCAAEKGYYDIVKSLLSTGKCNVHAKDNDGTTALMIAKEAGHQFVVSLLETHIKDLEKK